MVEQIFFWLIDNIAGALISACVGAILGICGTSFYFKKNYSIKNKLSQKGGDYSHNTQINGNYIANNK